MNGVTSSFGLEHSFSYVDVLILVELGEGCKLSAKSRDKVKLALVTLATDSRHEVLVNPRPEKYPHAYHFWRPPPVQSLEMFTHTRDNVSRKLESLS